MTPLLQAEGLVKCFGSLRAVDGLDLRLMPGELLGVIGPNGSGKSTLFNLLCGQAPADAGKITLLGREVTRLPAWRISRLGLVLCSQIPVAFEAMSLAENLVLAARNGGGLSARRAGEKAAEVLELVGLAEQARNPARGLNLAARRRLELARALAAGPRAILLDENLAGLTPAEVEQSLELLRAINRSGVALVMVEHIVRAVVSLCSRVMVLDFGQKIADGAPREVMNQPEVIRAYLGEGHA